MCGIAGIISFNSKTISRENIQLITEELSHRGPDDCGYGLEDNIAFGHRRLSIIDLTNGMQPMYSHDQRYLITFNGEIFNYLEIREELILQNAVFNTKSDTEVILEAFRLYGKECVTKFNGQFAFAIYDTQEKEVFLARDTIGEKPLYVYKNTEHFVFGSELKVIKKYADNQKQKLEYNKQAIFDYFSLNYVPFQDSFFKEISSLNPGATLLIKSGVVKKEYFVHKQEPECSETSAGKLEELLEKALDVRLRSDVPVGIFLSGGIDSSVISVLAARKTSNIKAYIADFKEAGFSEASNAMYVAKKIGIETEVITVNPDSENIPALIEKLVWHGDEPLADSSSLPFFLLSQQTSKHVKVVLSGDGADELFAGYLTYPATSIARSLPVFLKNFLQFSKVFLARPGTLTGKVSFSEKTDRFFRNLNLPPGAAHFAWNGMFNNKAKYKIFNPVFLKDIDQTETFEKLARNYSVNLFKPELRELLNADILGYLQKDILQKADRMSMAHGLEVRPVFMDPNIVSFARGLQDRQLLQRTKGKIILKELLQKIAPWYPKNLKKQGFSIPVHLWFRTYLKDYSHKIFTQHDYARFEMFERKEIMKLWQAHQDGKVNIGFELWGLLVAFIWLEKFSDTQSD